MEISVSLWTDQWKTLPDSLAVESGLTTIYIRVDTIADFGEQWPGS